MSRGHWLVKSEPGSYSWDDLVRDGRTVWDGVRNPEARSHLAGMARGDLALFYHSGDEKAVVGVAKVVRESFPDPKADDPKWLAVELALVKPLARPVSLAEIKQQRALAAIPLVKRARLSVMPLDAKAFAAILALGGTRLPA
ncbi:MAG TPA: EVE domain-containing protein [Myxococcota bacterium]|nr:EVE domain-containing protein [Myxococcota bacterium]